MASRKAGRGNYLDDDDYYDYQDDDYDDYDDYDDDQGDYDDYDVYATATGNKAGKGHANQSKKGKDNGHTAGQKKKSKQAQAKPSGVLKHPQAQQVVKHGEKGPQKSAGGSAEGSEKASSTNHDKEKHSGGGRVKAESVQGSFEVDLANLSLAESDRVGNKQDILLVVLGHVDAGKSTLAGRLMADLGLYDTKEIRKRAHQATQMGKGSFGWAFLMDERQEERERGVTIDLARRTFETQSRHVVLLDAPGHRDFVPNAISGICQADAVLLVIDGSVGGFESGFEKRGATSGQTREHAQLAKGIGIEQIAVIVTKLENSKESQERFTEIKNKMEPFLKSCGFASQSIQWLPASGITGDNITHSPVAPSCLSWFSGPTVIQSIDNFHCAERNMDQPFRMHVFAVSNTKAGGGGNVIATGRVVSGFRKSGQEVMILCANVLTTIKKIVPTQGKATFALAGDAVELILSCEDSTLLKPGSVLCDPVFPAKVTNKFNAKIRTFELPMPFTLGRSLEVYCHAAVSPARLTKLLSLHDSKTGEINKKNPRLIKSFQTASVEITLSENVCLESYAQCKSLGRLILRVEGQTIGVGIVMEVP